MRKKTEDKVIEEEEEEEEGQPLIVRQDSGLSAKVASYVFWENQNQAGAQI